jgi:hypothetical protein
MSVCLSAATLTCIFIFECILICIARYKMHSEMNIN